jgi:hypothetical protein
MGQATMRNLLRARPFLVLGMVALAVFVVGAMPAGFDYDPNVLRGVLRALFLVIGFPFVLIAVCLPSSIGIPIGIVLTIALGFVPYLLADWALRRWRARRSTAHRSTTTP